MAEYLAPAVYVEEVDTGSKPIEGVSTSTAGMLGVTERGPVNIPILVTSFGEYQRWFGQMLERGRYGEHRYLPHSVEGFFANGGKRVYVTRVLDIAGAVPASRQLVAPDSAAPLQSALLAPAAPTATMLTLVADPGFASGDTVQIGEGIGAEFIQLAPGAGPADTVTLRLPLAFDHLPSNPVERGTIADRAGPADHRSTLARAVQPGAGSIALDSPTFNPALAAGEVLRVGVADQEELVVVAGPPSPEGVVTLRTPLQLAHGGGDEVWRQDFTADGTSTVVASATAPASIVVPVSSRTGFTVADTGIRIGHGDATRIEYRRIGALTLLALTKAAYGDYPAGTRVHRVTLGAAGTAVDLVEDAHAGATVITVSSRTGMAEGGMLAIGLGTDTELVEIASLRGHVPPPNAGRVVLRAPLRIDHLATAGVVLPRAAPSAPALPATVVLDVAAGATSLLVPRAGYAAGDTIRVTTAAGGPFYHLVSAAPAPAAVTPQTVTLANPLSNPQAAGALVARRRPMMTVRAIDAGDWGNRLRVAMEMHDSAMLNTQVREVLPGGRLRLRSSAGVETGTELVVIDPAATETALKVAAIDRQNRDLITLEASTPLPGSVMPNDVVRSREYRFVVELLRQHDPANPARDNIAIDREVFAALSLDPRHSRYFQSVIGCTWNLSSAATTLDDMSRPLRRADRRSEGESNYVRVLDAAPSHGLRPGPLAAYDLRPGVPRRLVLLPLGNGDDGIGTLGDPTYIGDDNSDPELRTGLYTLRNVEEISIVAAPGRTSVQMQGALINHCELMRYRFAALDGMAPPGDSMSDIQAQRQQFDTKYAALYHPWLLIADPYPANPAAPADYPIPPSGHVLGIYARTDIERGVHKSPANEVVRGVIGLQRLLNKEQHDILNPYPLNINVIRDFRPNNRGIRVYGGRCITSDSDWKYVNVRRLLIFIENSIDRGLQWVVFEPNAEPLWARVRRAISNFLTLVWRNGGLEGTKVEEAFFVKCDRTTMTQTDIDQGRLICLVGVAPVKPAEFVIVRIGLWTAHAED